VGSTLGSAVGLGVGVGVTIPPMVRFPAPQHESLLTILKPKRLPAINCNSIYPLAVCVSSDTNGIHESEFV
jgi:hypothetical protein